MGACGIVEDGRLLCWGIIGDDKLRFSKRKPFREHQLAKDFSGFSELALGGNTLCAIEKKSKKLS